MSKKANELNLQVFDVHMGMFDYGVRFCIGEYKKAVEYVAWVYKIDKEDLFKPIHEPRGTCFNRPGYVPIIWVEKKPETPREIATLAHECIHAISYMFDWANMPFCNETEEAFCHATAHIMNVALGKIK